MVKRLPEGAQHLDHGARYLGRHGNLVQLPGGEGDGAARLPRALPDRVALRLQQPVEPRLEGRDRLQGKRVVVGEGDARAGRVMLEGGDQPCALRALGTLPRPDRRAATCRLNVPDRQQDQARVAQPEIGQRRLVDRAHEPAHPLAPRVLALVQARRTAACLSSRGDEAAPLTMSDRKAAFT